MLRVNKYRYRTRLAVALLLPLLRLLTLQPSSSKTSQSDQMPSEVKLIPKHRPLFPLGSLLLPGGVLLHVVRTPTRLTAAAGRGAAACCPFSHGVWLRRRFLLPRCNLKLQTTSSAPPVVFSSHSRVSSQQQAVSIQHRTVSDQQPMVSGRWPFRGRLPWPQSHLTTSYINPVPTHVLNVVPACGMDRGAPRSFVWGRRIHRHPNRAQTHLPP